MAESKRWVVTTSPDHVFGEVARELSKAGLRLDQQLDAIGVVIGDADEAVAERLKSVPGVADVSPDTPVDIGPPDAPKTW